MQANVRAREAAMRITLPCLLLALAAPPAGASEIIRLTPEQSDQAIEAGAARNAGRDAEPPELRGGRPQIHGEVGMMVGSGGARGVYGTAGMPIGDDGFAAFSYENVRYGRRQWRP
jgi:hypothetical protein